mgnify:CR=1 FL=1
MVIIRLSRSGSKKRPYFNVVVADSKKRRDGRFIERVGFYNPGANQGSEALRLDTDRITYWQSHGALLSETAVLRERPNTRDCVITDYFDRIFLETGEFSDLKFERFYDKVRR